MKKILGLVILSIFLIPNLSLAQTAFKTKEINACGGQIIANADCDNNKRKHWFVSCCDEGYRIQGIQYSDHEFGDTVDTLSAVCRSVSQGNKAVASKDFGIEEKNALVCHKTEILSGVVWKDFVTTHRRQTDSMDGLSPICLNPSNGKVRTLSNKDIDGKDYKASTRLPKRVVGIASKERLTDTTDCVALIVK